MPKYSHIFIVAFFVLISAWTSSFAGNNSGAAFSTWPDTGQTKCYNDTEEMQCPGPGEPFHGQDAQYHGPARSYSLLGGGTMVQDSVTGLIWERKTNMDGVFDYNNPNDADNTYTWCDPNPLTNGTGTGTCGTNDTVDFIDQLNGSGFGGYTNWRIPTINELATLVDLGQTYPVIDPIFTATTQSSDYWSSTTLLGGPYFAWRVRFGWGQVSIQGKSNAYYVRAVCDGQPLNADRYVDNNDGTVTDTVTCLQWQKATMDTKNGIGPDTYNWQDALAASENLSLAGHTDWRLPDRNELRSIVDYSRGNPAIEPVLAATTQSSGYWSSTTDAGNPDYAWHVNFYGGDGYGDYKSSAYYVRAVRGGQCGSIGALGDVNKDGAVNLSDTILALQVISGIVPVDTISTDNEVSGDGQVGLADAIYILRAVAQLIDVTPPAIVSGPSVSDTTATGTNLAVTINENGTGHYLLQEATVAPPSIIGVAIKTGFAATANVKANVKISGLTPTTAYKIYFIAKDTAGNTQTSMQSVSFTTGTLNDTGITWGGSYPSGISSNCNSNISGDQDCNQGRDATHNDNSDGHAGFSYTKLDSNGNNLPANDASWNCVRDNVTGLVWEVKTDDGGIHDKDNVYRWGGKTVLGSDYSTYYSDWESLVDGSNNAGFCGYSNWRLPTRMELMSLVNYGRITPAIDIDYFPNTASSYFWSASPISAYSDYAWCVNFDNGVAYYSMRSNNWPVRLVCSGE